LHRFAAKPSWGEIGFSEWIIYSGRYPDLAYMTPISFFKSLEHALHDRDNSGMALDGTFRFLDMFQIKGSFFLDDIIFENIGKGYWSNKFAWNIGAVAALPANIDMGVEYSRVEPYTYSHFNIQNNMTNDGRLFGTYLYPNSDETMFLVNWWYGGRYPLTLKVFYQRHGENIYDKDGNLIKNVGGDFRYIPRPADPSTGFPGDPGFGLKFLDGNQVNTVRIQIGGGFELARGWNIEALYQLKSEKDKVTNGARIVFRYGDF
jgi:hypothetical protein